MTAPIRYTPITEGYRPLVELSLSILRHQPFSASTSGNDNVIGVLLDMAEIWELYVFELLRAELASYDVTHPGRDDSSHSYLIKSHQSGQRIGGLKPDIVIRRNFNGPCVGIFDAKYKTTTPGRERTNGIMREDLYQMSAYLAAYGTQTRPVHGALVYPMMERDDLAVRPLQAKDHGSFASLPGKLNFLGLTVAPDGACGQFLSSEETGFIDAANHVLAKAKS